MPNDGTRTNHQLRRDMRRFDDDDEVDLVIVGCGAGGSVLAQRLARPGWRVVALDAGPFWDPDRDWVSDERGSHHLYWTEPRVIAGDDPVALGSNNSGRGVGGSMVHFAGYAPRFHPSDFRTRSTRRRRRRLADRVRRPAALLRAPRGGAAGRRRALAVGRSARLPALAAPGRRQRRRRSSAAATRLGIDVRVGPVAIINGRIGQPAALHLPRLLPPGLQGQREGVAAHHPRARRAGARRRDPRRLHGQPGARRRAHRPGDRRDATSATASNGANGRGWSRSPATPSRRHGCSSTQRAPTFPEGLCNDFDLVGRYVMVQGAPQTAGRYRRGGAAYKAPPPEVSTEAFYETDPTKEYQRGFSIQCVSPLPITFAEHVAAQGHWGGVLREYMRDYVHWATFGALCEFLPLPDNRVTLADETDRHGLPVAPLRLLPVRERPAARARRHRSHGDHPRSGRRRGSDHYQPLRASRRRMSHGAAPRPPVSSTPTSARSPSRTCFITDGSVLPTQGSANPALTIMALAARAADRLDR